MSCCTSQHPAVLNTKKALCCGWWLCTDCQRCGNREYKQAKLYTEKLDLELLTDEVVLSLP